MIHIEKIHIHEFRGIRDLAVELKSQNFTAYGPNGTGKSGIVDAIEFALTGNISRLKGSGTGGLSVKAHAPHVDKRNKPEDAFVSLDISVPSLKGKKATITRTVKQPNTPKITPKDADILTIFNSVGRHPEFVLSRRELIRYVVSEPGKRSQEVQAILRLDDIEKLRTVFQKIANTCKRDLDTRKRSLDDTRERLRLALDIPVLNKENILAAANSRRSLLGLTPLVEFGIETSLKDGLTTASTSVSGTRISKIQVQASFTALSEAIETLRADDFQIKRKSASALAEELLKEGADKNNLSREAFLKQALTFYDDNACPVCDTAIEPAIFKKHLAEKLSHLDAVAKKRTKLEEHIQPLLSVLHGVESSLTAIIGYAPQFVPPINVSALTNFKSVLCSYYQVLQKITPIDDAYSILIIDDMVPSDMASALEVVATAIKAIPEPSAQDAARDFLVLAQERLEASSKAKMEFKVSEFQDNRAAKILATYAEVTTSALEKIYKDVETTFATYYRKINEEDESSFTAKLIPSLGKLGFDVDFYGRGHFPPGAYHSEGHQDGMGLCLYLALMRHLLSGNFTFAVLDDVLMSVDAGHRRKVCELLKQDFPGTQFIFTTHDEVWLKHMKSEGLITGKNYVHFRTWSVDCGPISWNSMDVWGEVDEHLSKSDVQAASAHLRHYLEYFAKEGCERLRADVEFRGDGQFMLGDLLPQMTSAFGHLLKKAKDAANSWNHQDVISKIVERENIFNELKLKTNSEQWQINAAIHFNAWANLSKEDFTPVVATFKAFTSAFVCPHCGGMYYVSPPREKKEALRCECGGLNLNLVKKSG